MSDTKKLYGEFTSLKEDGAIEVILNEKLNILTLVISENGVSMKVRFDLNVKGSNVEEQLSYVDNLRRKANLFGRASQEIKNYLKKYTYQALFDDGIIDRELFEQKVGLSKK